MHLTNISVKNFRNFNHVDFPVGPGAVLVGENRSGKSNLVHALRLVLDPSLPNSERMLRSEDFWDGLDDGSDGWDPMRAGETIEIAIDFGDIGDDPVAIASLGDCLIEGEPMLARATYRFAPREVAEPDSDHPSYDWKIFGGLTDTNELSNELRRYLRLTFMSALRDAERDIASWRRSPLKPLLSAALEETDPAELEKAVAAVADANDEVVALEAVKKLGKHIEGRTVGLVGDEQGLETALGIAPSDPQQLIRALRIFVDGVGRPLSSSSLGTLNVLYLALLQLELGREFEIRDLAHLLIAIEEPEAHLHPHLQRLVFKDLLRPAPEQERSVIVTSHSPHIVSVSDPRNLVVLRRESNETSVGSGRRADLRDAEWADLDRYLDATRGELVFARRVLMVEGFAETVIVPRLADELDIDLDKFGISVCPIHGTHFATYVRYLDALGTPWSVITDGDPGEKAKRGDKRAKKLATLLGHDGEDPTELGIFVGDVSLEPDLIAAGDENQDAAIEVFKGFTFGATLTGVLDSWEEDASISGANLDRLIRSIGKGRFAQRLVQSERTLEAPDYIAHALARLVL
jgi:putative ATP-dependent endonuclease of OLD family